MLIRDLDLTNHFEELYKKPVFLYGAGNNGKVALKILREFGIEPEAFCDTNSAKKGCMIETTIIRSLDELINISQMREIIIIITTASLHYDSIVNILAHNKINCRQIYTFTGLLYASYFNLDACGTGRKLSAMKNIWLHNQRLALNWLQGEVNLYKLLLRGTENRPFVFVYQPGKVGSNTVAHSLRECGVEVIRSHGMNYPSICSGSTEIKQQFIDCILSLDTVKMITLFREPISKDIGHFFQKMDFELPDAGWFVKGLAEKDFNSSFLNYLSIVTPFDFTENNRKKEFCERNICHIDVIGQESAKGSLWGWFDEELKNNFGIDVFNEDFHIEKGYSIIKHRNIELLIMKLEELDHLEDVIADFVGISNFKIIKTNQGKAKSYRYAYAQFLEEVRFPEEYLNFYYKDNRCVNHFYSESEREKYYLKWKQHI